MKPSRAVPSTGFSIAGGAGAIADRDLRHLAWECRVLAKTMHDESTRLELLFVAEQLERLARV
jgi:hypothetical protein